MVSPLSTAYLLPTSSDADVRASGKHRWLVPPAVFFYPSFQFLHRSFIPPLSYGQHDQKFLYCFSLSPIAFRWRIWYYVVISKGVPSTVVSPLSTVYLLPTSLGAAICASERHRWLVPPAVFFLLLCLLRRRSRRPAAVLLPRFLRDLVGLSAIAAICML